MAIYFISTDNNYVKIGYSKNPKERIAALQTGSHSQIYTHGIITGGVSKEREIHNMFASLRHRGEWFKLTSEILSYMRNQKKWKPGITERLFKREKKKTAIKPEGVRYEIKRKRRGATRKNANSTAIPGWYYWVIQIDMETGKRSHLGTLSDLKKVNPERYNQYVKKHKLKI